MKRLWAAPPCLLPAGAFVKLSSCYSLLIAQIQGSEILRERGWCLKVKAVNTHFVTPRSYTFLRTAISACWDVNCSLDGTLWEREIFSPEARFLYSLCACQVPPHFLTSFQFCVWTILFISSCPSFPSFHGHLKANLKAIIQESSAQRYSLPF